MMAWHSNSRCFSLVELMVVISIILVLSGLAVGRLGALPVAASMERTERELGLLFAQCAHQAAVRGQTVEILYNPVGRCFEMNMSAAHNGLNERYLYSRFNTVTLAEGMEVTFHIAEENIRYRIRPDGTADGPSIILKLHDRRTRLDISPLTGQLLRQNNGRRK